MPTVFLVVKLMKKLATSINKMPRVKKWLWFIALYTASISALGIFHLVSRYVISILK